jgi:NADH:ubiquinone oxidoreductase subunit F (NADH-binding)/(2Fe-2S) ferredoxin/Pyruvate/2-oxoacid:ferredoxin oxidoreductase delta subunit
MSLMDLCCEKCTHTSTNSCKDYITCRISGPKCHKDEACKAKLTKARDELINGRSDLTIKVGMSTCGLASGSEAVYEAFKKKLDITGIEAELMKVGCMGLCYSEPLVELSKRNGTSIIYGRVKPENAPKILETYLARDSVGAMAIRDRKGTHKNEDATLLLSELPFNKGQYRDVITNCGSIDPRSIEAYIANGGYQALEKVLKDLSPDKVIETVKLAGLRGRGGAGFPTGLKWQLCKAVKGDQKYMICNADEGDPGAFMNRLLAEGDPHRVIEGLIIAAYAIGAVKGYIFVRAEKLQMAKILEAAVDAAYRNGLLGDSILGSPFSFDIDVMLSAGAFVCGEETALISAIEGNRAMPRPRPPYPAVSGLMGKPTTINNVETLAHVPTIILNSDYFMKAGTEKSKGTKVFCLAGKVARTGAAEIPFGMTLKQLIFDIGGGTVGNKKFKAVQTGGPSGGCLSEKFLGLPLDYESLQSANAIIGSGGVIVLDEDTCIVDLAKYFLTFTTAESCGKCTPCRIGLKRIHEILTRITEGQGTMADLDQLKSLSETISKSALCALGKTAPNPALTTLEYFRDEYLAHIVEKRCPAHVCHSLVSYKVDLDHCVACGLCHRNCPSGAMQLKEISGTKESIAVKQPIIDQENCIKCGVCYQNCPAHAIVRE